MPDKQDDDEERARQLRALLDAAGMAAGSASLPLDSSRLFNSAGQSSLHQSLPSLAGFPRTNDPRIDLLQQLHLGQQNQFQLAQQLQNERLLAIELTQHSQRMAQLQALDQLQQEATIRRQLASLSSMNVPPMPVHEMSLLANHPGEQALLTLLANRQSAERQRASAMEPSPAPAPVVTTTKRAPPKAAKPPENTKEDPPQGENSDDSDAKPQAKDTSNFPEKLYKLLMSEERPDIVSFMPSGKSFQVHDRKIFIDEVAPKYFRVLKFSSFKRQLYTYDFQIVNDGPETGAYIHPNFQRGRPDLLKEVRRATTGYVERNAKKRPT